MKLDVFSPSAFPQAQTRFDNSQMPRILEPSSQTQVSTQNPVPVQRVITSMPATESNFLNPVATGIATVNASLMDTLVEAISLETLFGPLRQRDSGSINESTGQGSLTQLPLIPPTAQTVESLFSATEHNGPGIHTSPAIASVDDPEGEIVCYSVVPLENEDSNMYTISSVAGPEMCGDDTARCFDALFPALSVDHEQQSYPEVVSDFGHKDVAEEFDEKQMSELPGLGTYLSMEEVRLMLSDGPCLRIGINELIKPEGDTLFELVNSSFEPDTNSGSAANNDDTGYMPKADSRIETVPQIIEEFPSVCGSPAFPAMLADSAETALQHIHDTKDRKSPGSENRKSKRAAKRKYKQANNPSGKIPGFLLEELNLSEEKRIIHWVNEECGIFRKDKPANDELARRWGVKKGNTKMTYDKLHRAIRYNYKNHHKPGSLTHLSFGIDGQSEGHKVSPFYQFDMDNKDVRGQIDYFKNNHAG